VKPSKMTEHAFVCTQMVVGHDVFAASITLRCSSPVVCCLSLSLLAVRRPLVYAGNASHHLWLCAAFLSPFYSPPLSRPPFVGRCVAGLCGLLYRTVLFLLLLQN